VSESRFGRVITFYSYKGGVGRTLALADVAVMLAKMGHRVLMVDWDIEAPGLAAYFRPWLPTQGGPSLLELIEQFEKLEPEEASRRWSTVSVPELGDRLALLPAVDPGTTDHARRVQALDWNAKYRDKFGNWLEELRGRWQRDWDFILVDSRTGFNDIGGICTIQLPEVLVVFFTPNEQSIEGTVRAARYAQEGQQRLPIDRAPLRVVPVATRLDNTEHEARRRWEHVYLERFQPLVDAWTDAPSRTRDLLKALAVPYVPYWSYGEQVPVLQGDTSDKLGVERAHENLALLLALQLVDVGRLLDERPRVVEDAYNASRYEYDVFLSYLVSDSARVSGVLSALEAMGLRTPRRHGFVRTEVRLGDSWLKALAHICERSRDAIIFLSDQLMSYSQEIEIETFQAAQREAPTSRRIVLVTLRGARLSDSVFHFVKPHFIVDGDAFDTPKALASAIAAALQQA